MQTPVIIDDEDEDFKVTAGAKGKEKKGREGGKRKRTRRRIEDSGEREGGREGDTSSQIDKKLCLDNLLPSCRLRG